MKLIKMFTVMSLLVLALVFSMTLIPEGSTTTMNDTPITGGYERGSGGYAWTGGAWRAGGNESIWTGGYARAGGNESAWTGGHFRAGGNDVTWTGARIRGSQ